MFGSPAAETVESTLPSRVRPESSVQRSEDLLRRLALNDEKAVRSVLQDAPVPAALDRRAGLDFKTHALVRLGALLSVGAATDSCRLAVDLARAAGADDEELVGALVAVGPAIGFARLVAVAPRLALAIGFDVDDDDDA
jgi:alkylhydroperoxidase/carboxymuconolactone decarboxylase family protein YurZ